MNQATQCPMPAAGNRGSENIERQRNRALAWIARLWRPDGAAEPVAATVSRFAMKLIDLATGRAYGADEVQLRPAAGTPVHGLAAALTVNPTGANNSIIYTAKTAGADGNSITVAYTTPVSAELTVAVTGSAISVAAGTKNFMGTNAVTVPATSGGLISVDGGTEKEWSSDGSSKIATSGAWMSLWLDDGVFHLEHYTNGTLDGSWTSGEGEWPDGLTFTADGLETGAPSFSAVIPSASRVIDAVNADDAASALVTATASGTVTGAVAAIAAAPLASGRNATTARQGQELYDSSFRYLATTDIAVSSTSGWVKSAVAGV